jgi:hypothetical protein
VGEDDERDDMVRPLVKAVSALLLSASSTVGSLYLQHSSPPRNTCLRSHWEASQFELPRDNGSSWSYISILASGYFYLPAVHLFWNGDAFAVSFNRASTALHWWVHRERNTYNNGKYKSLNISSERPSATSINFLHPAMHFVRDLDPSTKV